jgi:hypothetical protein
MDFDASISILPTSLKIIGVDAIMRYNRPLYKSNSIKPGLSFRNQ